jgi:hypothetical protein
LRPITTDAKKIDAMKLAASITISCTIWSLLRASQTGAIATSTTAIRLSLTSSRSPCGSPSAGASHRP